MITRLFKRFLVSIAMVFIRGFTGGNPDRLQIHESVIEKVSDVSQEVMNDFNTLTAKEFKYKYYAGKYKYYKRVMLYEDPYMNSPLAKFGKAFGEQV